MARGFDPVAQAGKAPDPERRVDILVVGGGPAGASAAVEAAKGGASVLLVDENPVDPGLMGLDTPLYYGARYTSATHKPERLKAQIFAANPLLEAAVEAGADVELGVSCWGAFTPGYGLASLPGPLAGLADAERAWMVGFERIIVAAGARDVAFSFPGWDQPGVMGARALTALAETYEVFAGRRLVILGAGELGLGVALSSLRRGLDVAAIVEIEDEAPGSPDLREQTARAGVSILLGSVPVLTSGGIDGVTSLEVRSRSGDVRVIDCDTIVQAISLTPAIELLDVLGAKLAMRGKLGGYAPVSPDGVSTSLPNVFVAGDGAGVPGGAALPDAEAEQSGRRAASAALASLGRARRETLGRRSADGLDAAVRQQAWVRALMAANPLTTVVCQCEDVSLGALLGVHPPAYLGVPSSVQLARDLDRLLEDGPANQDQIKRLTRAGMGPCQGRRCREQVALSIAQVSNVTPGRIPLASYRAPVRPLPVKVLAAWDEASVVSRNWDVWMGIAGQWTPYDDIGTKREALSAGILGGESG